MEEKSRGKIVIYKPKSGEVRLKVKFKQETVWLSQKQMAELFDKNIRTINEHIQNIYREHELNKGSTVRKFRTVQIEGKRRVTRDVDLYNLDVIISVGYRIKSKRGTQFRIWATKVLRDHIIKGYTINQGRLKQQRQVRLAELQRTVGFLKEVIGKKQLEGDETTGLLKVITDYANTWALLEKYDKGSLKRKGIKSAVKVKVFDYQEAKKLILKLKNNLSKKKEASRFFAVECDEGLAGIFGNLNQEIAGRPVYSTFEEKAAHLLYFVIKDRVFIDGNKRIAAFLFILFLSRNKFLFNEKGEKRMNDTALVALTLLVAESKSRDKDIMIKLITNLLY